MRQIYLGRVNDSFAGFIAARYLNGLRAVMGLLSARAARFPSLRAAAIDGLRKLVSRVINDIPLGPWRRNKRLQTGNALGKHDDGDEQKTLEQPRPEHAAIGKDADGRFSGQRLGSARERRPKGCLEFLPGRRPLHEQAWRIGPLLSRNSFGNGLDFGHSILLGRFSIV